MTTYVAYVPEPNPPPDNSEATAFFLQFNSTPYSFQEGNQMNNKSRTFFRRTAASGNLILALAIVMLVMTTASADVGTAFTYQGQLLDGSGVVSDTCDLQFSLYDAATDGTQVGSTVTKTNVDVDDGLFTVELDFGTGAFGGDPRWLELAVRCPAGSGVYDTLSPRQSIAPAPYAVYAARASIASDVEPGAITPTHLNGLPGNGTSGQVLASDGSGGFGWQGVSSLPVKQLVQDFVMASGESVSAGDVVAFANGEVYSASNDWVSEGSESVFNATSTVYIAVSALSASDFVVAYRDVSGYGTAIVGTVSGGTISWGSESVFNAATTSYIAVNALSATDFVVAYQDEGNLDYGTAIVGIVSGGTVSWGSESVFNAAGTVYIAVSALSASDFVVAYTDTDSYSWSGTAIVGRRISGYRFIGTAKTAASGGETVTVIISGVSDVHSGLVPGQFYYLQQDGSLDLTPTGYRVGLAISETELILDQLW
jgi:hypothetical protein